MSNFWLTCPCGEPVLKFLPDTLPLEGSTIFAKHFEGVNPNDPMPACPACGNVNLFNKVNIKERDEKNVETGQ